MRHSSDFYRRLALIAMENDAVRVALSLLALTVLALAGLPTLLTLTLPLLAYAGLCLLSAPVHRPSGGRRHPPARSADEAYAACVRIKRKLDGYAGRLQDARSAAHLHHIATHIDKSLDVIASDGRHQASAGLLGLAETTDRLLIAYLKVVDRGFGCAELRERLRDNLTTLDGEYERFWVRLNRETIVDLEALSATIDFNLNELGSFTRLGATP